MEFYLLQSGSAGNSCLIVSGSNKIMIDVGVRYSLLKEKLNTVGYNLNDIDGFLITHEHSDHIQSIKYIDINKIYATKETLDYYGFHELIPYKLFEIGCFKIVPISISHDIKNGLGYLIDDGKESLLYLTDTGKVLTKNLPFMKNCTHYIIESNHNVDMLYASHRPDYLIKRILSNKGHLSNVQAGKVMSKCIGNLTKSITLAHISGEANTKDLALKEFKEVLDENNIDYSNIFIQAADRQEITYGLNYVK